MVRFTIAPGTCHYICGYLDMTRISVRSYALRTASRALSSTAAHPDLASSQFGDLCVSPFEKNCHGRYTGACRFMHA